MQIIIDRLIHTYLCSKAMLAFIAADNNWRKVKVFSLADAAKEYTMTRGCSFKWQVLMERCPQATEVFVVVSGMQYKGLETIRVFVSPEQVVQHIEDNVFDRDDCAIFKRTVQV